MWGHESLLIFMFQGDAYQKTQRLGVGQVEVVKSISCSSKRSEFSSNTLLLGGSGPPVIPFQGTRCALWPLPPPPKIDDRAPCTVVRVTLSITEPSRAPALSLHRTTDR